MVRYAFDNDWSIEKCEDCPIVGVNHGFNMCMFQSELNPFGRILKPDEGVDSRPSWCPLRPLEEQTDDAKRDDSKHSDVMNITRHYVMLQPHGRYVFDTVECPRCKERRTIDIDHWTMFCPSCGGALDAEPNVVERRHWELHPSQQKDAQPKDVGRVVQSFS